MRFDTLFFDVGETLTYRVEPVPHTLARLCDERGIAVAVPPDIDPRAAEFFELHRKKYFTREGIDEFVRIYFRHILDQLGAPELPEDVFSEIVRETDYYGTRHFRLFPDALDVLRQARAQFKTVAAVSNWNVHLEEYLDGLGLLEHFAFVVVSDIEGVWKPDPKIFQIALERAGADPARSAYIGNAYREDVLGARAAGIRPFLVIRNDAPPPPEGDAYPNLTAALAAIRGEPWSAVPEGPVDIRVERAVPADAVDILRVQRLAFTTEAVVYDEFGIHSLTQPIEELVRDFDKMKVFKASTNGRVVGSVRGFVDDGTLHVCMMVVHPEFWNIGIASRLITALEAAFPEARRCELFTGYRSERNIHLYQKLGYSIFGEKKFSEKLRFVLMEKVR